jgi:hypothetical protein
MAMRTRPKGKPEAKDSSETAAVRQEVIDRRTLWTAPGLSPVGDFKSGTEMST